MHNDLGNYLSSVFPGIDFTDKSNEIKKQLNNLINLKEINLSLITALLI